MQIEKSIIYALKDTDCPLYDPITRPDGIIPIIANLDQPEPREPYLLINIINTTKIGLPYKSVVNNGIDIKEYIFQVKDFYVGLILHTTTKSEFQDWFNHFENGVHSDMVDWAFYQQGLALVESEAIMYQPLPISGTAYKRAIMNITLRAEVLEKYMVKDIKRVNIEGNLTDSLNSNVSEVIVNIEK